MKRVIIRAVFKIRKPVVALYYYDRRGFGIVQNRINNPLHNDVCIPEVAKEKFAAKSRFVVHYHRRFIFPPVFIIKKRWMGEIKMGIYKFWFGAGPGRNMYDRIFHDPIESPFPELIIVRLKLF